MRNLIKLVFINGALDYSVAVGPAEHGQQAVDMAINDAQYCEWTHIARTVDAARTRLMGYYDIPMADQLKEFIALPSDGGFIRMYEVDCSDGVMHQVMLWI